MKNKASDNISIKADKFSYILIMATAAITVLIMDLLYVTLNYTTTSMIINISTIVSYIIVVSIMFIIWGITNNSKLSVILTLIMASLITIVNQIKMMYMGEPIFFSDIGHLKNIGEIISIIDSTFFSMIKKYIPITIVGLLILGIFIYKFKSAPIYSGINSNKNRILIIIIPIIVLCLLFFPTKTTKNIYLNLFYNASNIENYSYIVANHEYYSRNGVIGGIYGQFLECLIHEPDGYNENELNKLLLSVEDKADEKQLKTPNIIVILSETFWDISKLNEIKFDKDITPNFNSLKENGVHFEMLSPSYGGTTANVEMEFLTGFNLAYYSNGYIPYLQLYKNNKSTPNIITELKNNGYVTKIISGSSENLFNAKNVYEIFGVDKMEFLENVDDKCKKGDNVSDEYITDKIIQEIENNNDKFFCMALTMQAHMPYNIEKYDNYDIKMTESNLNKEMQETVLSYAQGIYDADKQLGRLYEYIQTIEEPTIVIFFGDHLPYLKTATGNDVMEKLEYFNTNDEVLNNYRKYNTEALLISNFEIKDRGTRCMGPDLIMPYILNNMDIKLSPYYKWLSQTVETLPSYNKMVMTNCDGEIIDITKIMGETKKQYLLRQQLQYMLFIE